MLKSFLKRYQIDNAQTIFDLMPKYNIIPNEWNYSMMILKNLKLLRRDKATELF